MKNVVECCKQFFGYFNALETNGELGKEFFWWSSFYVFEDLITKFDKMTIQKYLTVYSKLKNKPCRCQMTFFIM